MHLERSRIARNIPERDPRVLIGFFYYLRLLTGVSMALSNVITAFALVALGLLACIH